MEQQTVTNITPYLSEWRQSLKNNMIGKKLSELRTPSLVIDKAILERNCQQLGKIHTELNTNIRIHVKTHKTVEAARIQLEGAKSDAIVVSTLAEAYFMIESDLVLLGFPITPDKFDDLFKLSRKVTSFQIFIDNSSTLDALESYCRLRNESLKANVFLKIDCGYGRAGIPVDQEESIELARRLQASEHVNFLGIYSHAGHSYASQTANAALEYLENECNSARAFRNRFEQHGITIKTISIGATPTVKAIIRFMDDARIKNILQGITEVHAGAYAFLDRQQVSTTLGTLDDVAVSVMGRVASKYPNRHSILIDAGGLALSKDTAPQGGFGYVLLDLKHKKPVATVSKVSQEHGIITDIDQELFSSLHIGQIVHVVPNHCCLTCACHLYYVVIEEGNDTVIDVWVPVKGW
ncbi:hypothetical protein BCV72DRAFT_202900 [Rhizopus microsporus var. microsporus]|uniref:D-serine dehydratase n=1 Tax=Rhizopus microsporus var. microsporus TaxID=86635 RepID=A0A1X0R9K0_RHIZD|nr:hypothetical protein BCV72DRAFT_202900 [Rhizopus microsporus var. microsporus]